MHILLWLLALGSLCGLSGCSGSAGSGDAWPGRTSDLPIAVDLGAVDAAIAPLDGTGGEAGTDFALAVAIDFQVTGRDASNHGRDGASCGGDGGGGSCYANACPAAHHSLQDNRDRLIADLAKRKCTDRCPLWAALNQAERYIFLMDTAYLAASGSRLYPPAYNNEETALDHAVALYSLNGPKAGQGVDGSGRGGNDYNRIYLGFDPLATCVMRDFANANPTHAAGFNQWVRSDDLAGPHAPFTQREMIFWYKALFDLMSEGPQFHHWAKDSDFNQNGIDQRLGVCGVTDRSLTELTIAFDFYHNSDPLGDYAGRGGHGWQIVDQHIDINANWSYMPSGCPVTQPVNTDPYGGGTFAGMGPSLVGGACSSPRPGDGGTC